MAQRLGAGLIGADSSAVAVSDARDRRPLFPGAARAGFLVTDVTSTGLAGRRADDRLGGIGNRAGAVPPRSVRRLAAGEGLRPDGLIEQPAWLERQLRIYRSAEAAAAASHHDPALADLAAEG